MRSGVLFQINGFRRRLNCRFLLLLGCLALFFPASVKTAKAQGGPPLITDDPGTPGNNHWEINIATTVERTRDGIEQEAPIMDVNYGVGRRLQLKFEVPYLRVKDEGERALWGLGNSNVGVKWRFAENEKRGWAVSTYPQLEFNNPTSSVRRGLVERGAQFLLPIEVSHKFLQLNVNEDFGYLFKQNRMDGWIYGIAFGRQTTKRLELLGEVHGEALRNFKEDELLFNLGGRFGVSKHLTLLFSSGRSFRRAASGEPTFILYAGTQLTF
jgi:hypothetical protein